MGLSRVADVLHKIVGVSLFTVTLVGSVNIGSMFFFKYRQANLAERLLEEETADVFASHYPAAVAPSSS
ncbi:hypothetical protein BASA50_010987 [Batrachochytrium salamandrivorans]|uniref:Uncharacterized protein n=1 Tax=Batrachochytrium salamandrivorans TaxID=1357716 RepID=A0ABQ8EX17_9FUNG|nr:hypothetical protein BASA62_008183 [Batrachochytrium salamandrivorans]KAH6585455.1 hypothetical protein BASA61_006802 [Batrachochytrium salamandrivorans]KAH6587968.1 hypothetical protein BASA50_010987 [Batrachochytrium salamandrivorans]KAH9245101.1 hypothetical protein BASA81_017437 [Batrachochytrium salamandrivorans]KAH9270515.1 hypothetical protein BASA83_007327 [Batrachochytrium salamandrivorans]